MEQQIENVKFFEKLFQQLNVGGIWFGDDGFMKKVKLPGMKNEVFIAEQETYCFMKNAVPSWWLTNRVVLSAVLA